METQAEVQESAVISKEEFPLIYSDETGKKWLFKRTKSPRAFIREDGVKLSHTHVLFNYDFVGRSFYKTKKRKDKAITL
jgi:hypothetical protein